MVKRIISCKHIEKELERRRQHLDLETVQDICYGYHHIILESDDAIALCDNCYEILAAKIIMRSLSIVSGACSWTSLLSKEDKAAWL